MNVFFYQDNQQSQGKQALSVFKTSEHVIICYEDAHTCVQFA
jgi:hypothetical protein